MLTLERQWHPERTAWASMGFGGRPGGLGAGADTAITMRAQAFPPARTITNMVVLGKGIVERIMIEHMWSPLDMTYRYVKTAWSNEPTLILVFASLRPSDIDKTYFCLLLHSSPSQSMYEHFGLIYLDGDNSCFTSCEPRVDYLHRSFVLKKCHSAMRPSALRHKVSACIARYLSCRERHTRPFEHGRQGLFQPTRSKTLSNTQVPDDLPMSSTLSCP